MRFLHAAEAMELRRNITLSVILHGMIVVAILAFAGRNAVLSHIPRNYIAVSLLEYAGEKRSAPFDTIKKVSKNPETKSGEVLPAPKKTGDISQRKVSSNNEEVIPFQYPKNSQTSEAKAVRESQPDTSAERTLREGREVPVSLQMKPTESGAGDDLTPSAGTQATMSGKSMEVKLTGSHTAGGGAGTNNIINQIKAAIQRAKRYPVFARERGQEGTVVTEFSINEKGRPENIRIIQSSGFNLLDTAARDTVIRAAPFPLVSAPVTVNIIFSIDVVQSGRR
ncbi:MAG TPA: energy transducer TonB [Thermodesulfovibrionales bacterium]|nr:energy transducer TonB [Thermodesulfovibrionales bacterium]